jgi:hypothetical protein
MPAAADILETPDTQALFERYHLGWETRDPKLIASLHSADTVFHVHDGSEPVFGRDELLSHCAGLFEQYDFSLERGRLLCGSDFWVFEWQMVMNFTGTDGVPFTATCEMLDVVTLNEAGEVVRKDVFVNGAQQQAAFMRAGISL